LVTFSTRAQLPTNNIAPQKIALMTDTNGTFAGGVIIRPVNGGLGIANTNYVPSGATYNQVDANGYSCTFVTLDTTRWYFAVVPGQGNGNDVGIFWDTNNYSSAISVDGLFQPTNAIVELLGNNAGSTVGTQIYPLVTNLYGFLGGQFDGALSTNATIPVTVIANSGGFVGGRLVAIADSTLEHFIISTNTTDESTLSLFRAGPHGYADINFFTHTSTNVVPPNAPKLWFAIGVHDPGQGVSEPPYDQPYLESYSAANPFYFVGAGDIFGGFYSTASRDGDWVWFRDGTTNTPMFRINRSTGTVSNNCNVVCQSNLILRARSATPTAAEIGIGSLMWCSNGTCSTYISKSTNGSSVTTALIAP
jgi:hypothetical protein